MNRLSLFHPLPIQVKSSWLLVSAFVLMLPVFAFSRNQPKLYTWSAGCRIGLPISLSVKHYATSKFSFEGMAAYSNVSAKASWTQVALAAQYNIPFENIKNFNWYIGVGVAAYLWNWKDGFNGEGNSKTVFGTFAQLGLDYKFKKAPINISLDWMPVFQLSGYGSGLAIVGGAVGLRYVFQ